jgi:hypothetical protein
MVVYIKKLQRVSFIFVQIILSVVRPHVVFHRLLVSFSFRITLAGVCLNWFQFGAQFAVGY